jgi:hypothetical protein
LILGTGSFGVLAWRYRHIPHIGRFDDDAVYLACAKSLRDGHGYRLASFPGEPAETKFPPIFPALLAAAWTRNLPFPDNLIRISPLLWLMVPALCGVSYGVFRSLQTGGATALMLTGLIALNPVVAMFGVSLMPELLFMVLAFGSLLLAQRAQNRWPLAMLAGLLGGTAYLTRTAGIPLIIAVPVWLGVRRQYRSAIGYAAAMLPAVAGWNWWCAANRVRTADPTLLFHTDYFGQYLRGMTWTDGPEALSINLAGLISNIGRLVLFHSDSNGGWLYGTYVLGVAVVLGTCAMLWTLRNVTPVGLFAAVYCAMLLVWNFPPNERFALPLLPIALAGAAWLVRRFADEVARTLKSAGVAIKTGVLLAAAAVNGWGLVRTLPAILDADVKQMTEAREAYRWAIESTGPETRFYAYNDALFYLYTGRHAAVPHTLNKSAGLQTRAPVEAMFANIPEWARRRGLAYGVLTASDFSRDLTSEESRRVAEAIARGRSRVRSFSDSMVLQFQLP